MSSPLPDQPVTDQPATGPLPADMRVQRSNRSHAGIAERLAAYLAERLPAGAEPRVLIGAGNDSNGLSSETLMLTLEQTVQGRREQSRMVARVAPSAEEWPVFSQYRLDHQFAVMQTVRDLTTVPVPPVHWLEPTGDVLGTPFFLMEHAEGEVPPDVLPYTFGDNWFYDASVADQRALQERTVQVLAEVHGIASPSERFAFLSEGLTGDTALRRHLNWTHRWYQHGVAVSGRSALLEKAFQVLEANWPQQADAAEPVLLWGDARVGNVIYRDFTPVAVLDWEMTGLGPRQIDVAWLVFAHEVFQHIATSLGVAGLPAVLRVEDVVATYSRITGHELPELPWFRLYCALLWGCVFLRTGARQVHFGEIAAPAAPEDLFHHRVLLEQLIDEVAGGAR